MPKPAASPLVETVTSFDEELKRFEHLVGEACRTKLVSEKALRRAAKAASEAAESEVRLGELMARFGALLHEVRQRNEDAQRRLREKEAEIVAKDKELRSFVARFQVLGQGAKEISQALQHAVTAPANGDAEGEARVNAGALTQIDELIERFLFASKTLVEEARAAGVPELADHVDELRKQIQAARKKLGRAADASGK